MNLNEGVVKALPVPEKGNRVHFFAGAILEGKAVPPGFGVRVTAAGAKSFVLDYRVGARQHRKTIGRWPTWSALRAARAARELRQKIDRGEDHPLTRRPLAAPATTVAEVIDLFMTRYGRASLRRPGEYERAFNRLVKPAIGAVEIYDLGRRQVVAMLDRIEDANGPVMADRTLAYLRKSLNWFASRDERFTPPFVKGMARTKARERARTRILTDDELRSLWLHLTGIFGAVVRTLLLTAQRRDEVANMRWSEIGTDGVWAIPAERYKNKRPQFVPLSAAVLELINQQHRHGDYVFVGRTGKTPFSGFSRAKRDLDEKVPLPDWRLHDLRRTARTLMTRAGVRPDIAERVLGHVIAGVEGVYDRHNYAAEKREALEKLAGLVDLILNPPAGATVVTLGA